MRTDADHPARVRDPAIELLLSHTATLTDGWCSRQRAQDCDGSGLAIGDAIAYGLARAASARRD